MTEAPNICAAIEQKLPPSDIVETPPSAEQESQYTVFDTNAVDSASDDQRPQAFGTLYIGVKTVTSINYHSILYKPFTEDGDGVVNDISHCVSVIPTGNDQVIHYRKVADDRTPYEFDIEIENLGSGNACFKEGVMTFGYTSWKWSGAFVTFATRVTQGTSLEVAPPPGFNSISVEERGTIDELDKIDPIAHVGRGEEIVQGDDEAQIYGNQFLQKIMMRSLDDDTIKALLPGLAALSPAEQTILDKNREFFRRGAVALLAEKLKDDGKIDPDLAKHIIYRWESYLQLVSKTAIPAGQTDPAVAYGLDRKRDAKLIATLQEQFRAASMACYELGYLKKCPEWSKFTRFPAYWFKTYAKTLLSEEHVQTWLAHTIQHGASDENAIDGKEQITIWMKKLSLLKHCAEAAGATSKEFEIDGIAGQLMGRLQMQPAYTQPLDTELSDAGKLLSDLDMKKCSPEFSGRFDKLSDTARDSMRALQTSAPKLLAALTDPTNKLRIDALSYWSKRLPTALKLEAPTVRQFIEYLEHAPIEESLLSELIPDPSLHSKAWFASSGGAKTFVQSAIHSAALYNFYSSLPTSSGQAFSKESSSEIGMSVLASFGETTNMLAKGVNPGVRVLAYTMGINGFTKSTISWVCNATKGMNTKIASIFEKLIGRAAKILHVVAVVGCVYNLITSFWDMNKKVDPNNPDDEAQHIFATIQFSLACVETFLLVGGFIAFLAGWTTCSSLAGPFALVVALLGGLAMIIYEVWFAPDPMKDVKSFLEKVAMVTGSYDTNQNIPKKEYIKFLDNLGKGSKYKSLPNEYRPEKLTDITKEDKPKKNTKKWIVITAAQDQAARDLESAIQGVFVAMSWYHPDNFEKLATAYLHLEHGCGYVRADNLFDPSFAAYMQGDSKFLDRYQRGIEDLRIQLNGFFSVFLTQTERALARRRTLILELMRGGRVVEF